MEDERFSESYTDNDVSVGTEAFWAKTMGVEDEGFSEPYSDHEFSPETE